MTASAISPTTIPPTKNGRTECCASGTVGAFSARAWPSDAMSGAPLWVWISCSGVGPLSSARAQAVVVRAVTATAKVNWPTLLLVIDKDSPAGVDPASV